jgi:5-formyltetrahydrofolate cyclo-ligase
MAQTKSDWRRTLLMARAAIPETTRRAASDEIGRRVLALQDFREARSILGYVALGAEVDVATVLAAAIEAAIDVYVPNGEHAAEPPLWNVFRKDEIAHQGVEARSLSYPVLAIVPGVGFDSSGVRLGRGGGFYDRALTALHQAGSVLVVGIAFECQIVPALPSDTWDQGVDLVVSEQRVLTAARGQKERKGALAR